MNIYALQGHKVKCVTQDGGYDYDKQQAMKYLEIDNMYTVDHTQVDSWSTTVFLQELPGIGFNSVFFEDVSEQDDEDDKFHPDWKRYNS